MKKLLVNVSSSERVTVGIVLLLAVFLATKLNNPTWVLIGLLIALIGLVVVAWGEFQAHVGGAMCVLGIAAQPMLATSPDRWPVTAFCAGLAVICWIDGITLIVALMAAGTVEGQGEFSSSVFD